MRLTILPDRYAICRLAADAAVPDWVPVDGFVSVTRTADELSVVCAEAVVPQEVPDGVQSERGWRMMQVAGPLDFGLTGILAALTAPLAAAAIPVFALSTFDTDYLLVRAAHVHRAADVLRAAGYRIDAANQT